HANGGSLFYYGFNTIDIGKWDYAALIGIEWFDIHSDYFRQFNYQSASMVYWLPGMCFFKRLDNYFYLNLGLQVPLGTEQLTDHSGNQSSNFVVGISPYEGLF